MIGSLGLLIVGASLRKLGLRDTLKVAAVVIGLYLYLWLAAVLIY